MDDSYKSQASGACGGSVIQKLLLAKIVYKNLLTYFIVKQIENN